MIKNYKVVEENGEKILILYFDFNYEFACFFNKNHKNSSMKNEIKKFLKNKKIKFNGDKIALSIGGIVLATLLIVENPKTLNDFDLVYLNKDILPNNNIIEVMNQKAIDNNVENSILLEETNLEQQEIKQENDNIQTKEIIDKEKNIPKKSVSVNDYDTIKQSTINESNHQEIESVTNNNILDEEVVIEETKQVQEQERISEDKKVTIYRTNGSVITLNMDEYLIGVVGAEMPASFDIEALKVQAIISRTYALKSIEIGRKLTDSVSTQSYKDNDELKAMWGNSYNKYYEKIKSAVIDTKELAIYYDSRYIDCVYFSTSNGKTEDSKYVWGNSIPYLKSVDSSWDKTTSSYLKVVSKDLINVLNILGISESDSTFSILSHDESGRVLEIKVGDKIFTGVEFRNLLGLRSADFEIDIDNDTINITTRGYGHGVGLSQYGANEMAKLGYNYEEIIKHYYTGVEIC